MAQHSLVAGSPPASSTGRRQRNGDGFQRLQALDDALMYRRAAWPNRAGTAPPRRAAGARTTAVTWS